MSSAMAGWKALSQCQRMNDFYWSDEVGMSLSTCGYCAIGVVFVAVCQDFTGVMRYSGPLLAAQQGLQGTFHLNPV